MKKIQDILLNNFIEVEAMENMYYRSDSFIYSATDGSAKLEEDGSYDFFTYYNALSVEKWRKYTFAERFFIVIEAKGTFNVEIFGYKGEGGHFQKESGGRFSFDCAKKEKFVIPFPALMKSNLLSFCVTAEKDTYIYSAYYAAETEKEKTDSPVISIVSEISSEENRADENTDILCGLLSGDNDLKKAIRFDLIDKNNLVSPNKEKRSGANLNIHKNADFTPDKEVTHILSLDEKALLSPESIKRLYIFLSLLKDEYKNILICGDVFDDFRPNSIIKISGEETSGLKKTDDPGYKTQMIHYDETEAIVEREMDHGEPLISLFCCQSAKSSSLKTVNDSFVIEPENALTLNGICIFVKNIKGLARSVVNKHDNVSALTKLHDLILGRSVEIEVTRHMYYRSDGLIEISPSTKANLLRDNTIYDFFTYFNSLSLAKWKKYTIAENIYLVLDAEGDFEIELFGHFKNKTGYQKEYLGKKRYSLEDREVVQLQFPNGIQSSLVAFSIRAEKDVKIYSAYYATDIDREKLRSPLISMVTTTFKKESYVRKNVELLTENLFNNDDYKDNFVWTIVDNGRTLEEGWLFNDKIRIVHNKNTGGAGGFAKGMMEALVQKPKPDYILLMDDDVLFMPESFMRLRNLLRMLRKEYTQHFISGAMLKMGQPNVQHEDIGKLNQQGYHEAVKPNYDLNLWDHIIDNEVIYDDIPHPYGAWWFCCIPTCTARLDNLPLPVFVRGDDVEYSLRNKAKLITMNGICIWHEGFEGKFSGALEYYQVNRNELAVRAMHPELFDVDCIGHIKMIFWEEVYKFNYKGASLLLDAIEDFMKGPEFFKKLDGEKSMKKKKQKDNQPVPLTPEIRAMINFETLYDASPVAGKQKFVYDYTYNGQARIPELLLKKKTGIIPYGWGYFPSNMALADTIIAVDMTNETYVTYKRDRKKFNRIKARYERLIDKYNKDHKRIEKEYQDSAAELTDEQFWNEYLN